MLPYELILNIMASRKGGVAKFDFLTMCQKFGVKFNEVDWLFLINKRKHGEPMSVYYIIGTGYWFSEEAEYYRYLIKFVHNNPQGTKDLPILMGKVPGFIIQNHDLFVEIFKPSDFGG